MSLLRPLTKAKLDEWLTRELRLVSGCEDCVLQMTEVLQNVGPEECNWSATASLTLGRNPDESFCARHAIAIIERAQQRFRVSE